MFLLIYPTYCLVCSLFANFLRSVEVCAHTHPPTPVNIERQCSEHIIQLMVGVWNSLLIQPPIHPPTPHSPLTNNSMNVEGGCSCNHPPHPSTYTCVQTIGNYSACSVRGTPEEKHPPSHPSSRTRKKTKKTETICIYVVCLDN